uniref:uncharacterized protein n=1 Tax=Myxine glutinosa TaxID=7769 RepID=UPI00358F99D7
MNKSLPSKTKKSSCWKRLKQKFTTHDKKNKCCGDIAPDGEPKMNKSLPSKTKKSSCWKRLKQKFTTHDKKNKCCGDIAPDGEPKMNKSLPSKTKKISCWKRLKQKFTTHDKKKCCGDIAHDGNAEPEVINESVDEESLTGSSLRHGEDDEITSSHEEFDVGQVVFGQWEVISKIGEGSAGFIYKGKDVKSAEEVTLKLAKSLDARMVLSQETCIMMSYCHPNLRKVKELNKTNNNYIGYFVWGSHL